jgi:hypothetical protein
VVLLAVLASLTLRLRLCTTTEYNTPAAINRVAPRACSGPVLSQAHSGLAAPSSARAIPLVLSDSRPRPHWAAGTAATTSGQLRPR